MPNALLHRLRTEAREWRRRLGVPPNAGRSADEVDSTGLLLALAYPDRVAQRRPGQPGRFLLRNGRGAVLPEGQALATAPYLVAAELDDRQRESRVFLAAPVSLEELEEHLGEQIEREEVTVWDHDAQAVTARRRERLGAIVIRDAPLANPDPATVTDALLGGIAAAGLGILPWGDGALRLRQRVAFLRRLDPSWPDLSDAALRATLADWLGPHIYGMRSRDDLGRLDLAGVLLARLTWDQRRALDELAPTHLVVPSGSRIAIDYADPEAPVLAVRLQEMFGLAETPRIARGTVPLTLHLLSPAHRPVQVTRDLAGFWRGTYFEVRKDLKGRYPKHAWPDDPLTAEATRRVKR